MTSDVCLTKDMSDILYVMQRLELTSNGGNGHCVKFHEERERTHVFPSSDSTELDSQHSWVRRGPREWLVSHELWGFVQNSVTSESGFMKTIKRTGSEEPCRFWLMRQESWELSCTWSLGRQLSGRFYNWVRSHGDPKPQQIKTMTLRRQITLHKGN